ncbi:ABC transporter substrate-binding protein [Streptomyces sp. NPDC048845]
MTGCGGGANADGSGGKAVLRFSWWGNPDRAERTERAVELFEKRHPGVEVQTSFAGYETYKQKLATQAAGGDAPDVMQLDYRQINQYATAGVLLDLGARDAVRTGGIDKGLLATGAVDGTQYAVPLGRGTQAVVYDTGAWRASGVELPRADWTWEEWGAAMAELSAADIPAGGEGGAGGTRVGGLDPGQSEDAFEMWLRGQGKALYTRDGKLGFSEDDLTRWWAWCDGLRKRGAVSEARQTTQLDGSVENTPLGRQQAVSDINWDAPASGYEAILGGPGSTALAPMPTGEDGTPGQYFKPSMFAGVSAATAHPEEAAALIDFIVNDPDAVEILGAGRGLPVNDRLRERLEPELTGFDRVIAAHHRSLEDRLKPPPPAPPKGDNALQTTFQRDYDQVSFGRKTPREAAAEFITEAKAELRP